MKRLIKNATIIDTEKTICGNVIIEDGIITDVLKDDYPLDEKNYQVIIDAKGLALMPSFVDMHCHLRDPGYEYKENMKSGMQAALSGGFTTLCAMANTKPTIDSVDVIKKNIEKAQELDLCDLIQVSAITKNFDESFVEIKEIRKYTPIFSNDGKPIDSSQIIEKALKKSSEHDFILSSHCEPETEQIKSQIEILEKVGGNLHICHISKEESVNIIKDAKSRFVNVTCEVTPHHIYDSELDYKVNPPFRQEKDRLSLIDAIRSGIIDVCGTDHAPHSKEDKENGCPGISNIDVAFAMYWQVFYDNAISINKLSHMLSFKPARLLGLNSGLIEKGYEANLVLIDLDEDYLIDINSFFSKSNNNPFHNKKVKGRVITTFKRGEIKYDNGHVV